MLLVTPQITAVEMYLTHQQEAKGGYHRLYQQPGLREGNNLLRDGYYSAQIIFMKRSAHSFWCVEEGRGE